MPTHAFTGVRAERKEFYQTLRAARAITKTEYTELITKLSREEKTARRRAEAAMIHRLTKTEYTEFITKLRREEETARRRAETAMMQRETVRIVRSLTKTEYTELITKLGREEETARRRAETAMMRRQTARIARAVARPAPVSDVLLDLRTTAIAPDDTDAIDAIYMRMAEAAARLVGVRHAYISISQNGKIERASIMTLNPEERNITTIVYRGIGKYTSIQGSDFIASVFSYSAKPGPIRALRAGTSIRVVITTRTELPPRRVSQSYRDGRVDHCVLAPLEAVLQDAMVGKAESTAKRWGQRLSRLQQFKKIYADGVPEDKMEEVASVLGVSIHMYDLVGNHTMKYNPSAHRSISFTNTRMNHVDVGKLVMNSTTFTRVTQEEMKVILEEHEKEGVFFMITGEGSIKEGVPRGITSVRGSYKVLNEHYDAFKAFNESIGIKEHSVDAIRNPVLNRFLQKASLVHSVPIELCGNPNDLEGVKQIDMVRAYTQHRSSPFYRGFPKAPTHFGRVTVSDPVSFLAKYIGVYSFRVLSVPSCFTRDFAPGCVYLRQSVEIEYLMSRGLRVELMAGAFSTQTFDFDYPQEMLEQKRYAIWAGKLGCDYSDNTYMFPANKKWVQHLTKEIGAHKITYYKQEGYCCISQPKTFNTTLHHVYGFITAYTRINMMEIMRLIPSENLVKVILDGVYFRGETPVTHVPVKDKSDELKEHHCNTSWYSPFLETTFDDLPVIDPRFLIPEGKIDNVIVLTGQGGSGKSYSVLHDTVFPDILYVTPVHALGEDKIAQGDIYKYATINKLVGADYKEKDGKIRKCAAYRDEHRAPNAIFIDELTMIPKAFLEKAIQMYPESLILIAGDVDRVQWYQCRSGAPHVGFSEIWLPSENHHIVEFLEDMRASKSPALMDMKLRIREEMRRVFALPDSDQGGVRDATKMCTFIIANYPTVSICDAIPMFREGDIWIAGTHRTNETLMIRDVHSSSERGSHTTHAYQGKTIDTKRTFVSLDCFEYAMAYTAISRVRSYEQLVLVRKY